MSEDDKIEVTDPGRELIDRIESEGVSVASVSDGHVFGFSVGVLKRMLADAEAAEGKKVIVFVKTPSRGLAS